MEDADKHTILDNYAQCKLGPTKKMFAPSSADFRSQTPVYSRELTAVGISVPSPDELRGPSRIELRAETPVDCF